MIWLPASVVGAGAFGAGNFLGGRASRQGLSPVGTAFVSHCFGLIALTILYFAVAGGGPLPWMWGVLGGCASGIATVLLYRSLRLGPMSVNAPVVAAVSILAATVAGLWSGQGLTVLATGGLVLAIVAIFAVSQASAGTADQRRYAGLMEALGAGVGFGVFSISLSHTAGFGAIPSLLVVRATSALLLGAIALATLHQVSASRYVRAGSPIGVLELIGNMLLAVALSVGNLPIIQAVFSLNPVVTASLARIVYRERLTRMQMVGAFAAFLAIPLLALGGS